KFEFSLNPGTHHFALFEYIQPGAPETRVWHANDFGCFSGAPFGGAISGAPQAPYFRDIYPPGIARLIKAGGYIGLNAHYHNDYFDYECLYDNGVTRPVRRDTSGNPTNLVFGVTTEDAMCILVGVYY